jgi:hypothetical protein
VNDAQRFRAQAELCLRLAGLMKDRTAADQLNAKAADYLAQAVELETHSAGPSLQPKPSGGRSSFVALAFVRIEGGLVPGEEVECPLPGIAIRRAQAMSTSDANAGAVAFVRQSPDLHTFGDATATVLKTFGEVPEDFDTA